ncbi:unnamed protein product [Schistocephalus solidus]|uniref:Uncharacterized protein n=1 Tax=Schistocephalus solidus TaxID=70667 RepID=A0A183SP19_SCHSO|nr:unnamed protein product [Schistocephalus solidus]
MLTSPVQSFLATFDLMVDCAAPVYSTEPQTWPSEILILLGYPANSPFWTLNLKFHFGSSLTNIPDSPVPTSAPPPS